VNTASWINHRNCILKAVDAKTGRELYKFKNPSGIIGNVTTYEHGGRQYVAILSGVGGWAGIGLAAGLLAPESAAAWNAHGVRAAAVIRSIVPSRGTSLCDGMFVIECAHDSPRGTERSRFGVRGWNATPVRRSATPGRLKPQCYPSSGLISGIGRRLIRWMIAIGWGYCYGIFQA
jgi:hypothetical protein